MTIKLTDFPELLLKSYIASYVRNNGLVWVFIVFFFSLIGDCYVTCLNCFLSPWISRTTARRTLGCNVVTWISVYPVTGRSSASETSSKSKSFGH